jgi:hypothetical protein
MGVLSVSKLLVILLIIPRSTIVLHLSKLLERLVCILSSMKIYSSPKYLVAHLPNDIGVVWRKGSHYANTYDGWTSTNPVDAFSFGWEHDHATMLDFTSALQTWMNDNA